ncbi:TPA: alcohol dehydrogenase catalytic domain-containing protein, partial [Candidatus Galligastranaerophilus intestinigallinarum]|nr:alcohol dehydrogenase catalytic domain-containing protein [Candidatus Galligastranaerophilus intestinigallinarum]
MKALIYNKNSDKKIELVEIEKPKIIKDTDVILKVTLSSICTSDIHIKKGFVPRAVNGVVLGHEFVGVVDEVGNNVKNLKIGDRVAVNCETFCNECYFCKNGFVNNCINGGWELGCRINGAQAEFVRIPYADNTLYKLPKNVSDRNALFVGDILSSGYFAALMLDIKKEDTIGIIGAGPVGMCAMISAKILGVKKIVAIDINEKRLEIAKNKGLADYFINPDKVDIEKEIKKITPYGLDGVIEAAGGKDTFNMAIQIARPNSTIGV